MLSLSIGDTVWDPKNYVLFTIVAFLDYSLRTSKKRVDNPSMRDKTAEFIFPKYPLFGGLIVFRNNLQKAINVYTRPSPPFLGGVWE